jgi:hypothetical protein
LDFFASLEHGNFNPDFSLIAAGRRANPTNLLCVQTKFLLQPLLSTAGCILIQAVTALIPANFLWLFCSTEKFFGTFSGHMRIVRAKLEKHGGG